MMAARKTAGCMGGVEYLMEAGGERGWVSKVDIKGREREMSEVEASGMMAHSLREVLERQHAGEGLGRGRGQGGVRSAAVQGG